MHNTLSQNEVMKEAEGQRCPKCRTNARQVQMLMSAFWYCDVCKDDVSKLSNSARGDEILPSGLRVCDGAPLDESVCRPLRDTINKHFKGWGWVPCPGDRARILPTSDAAGVVHGATITIGRVEAWDYDMGAYCVEPVFDDRHLAPAGVWSKDLEPVSHKTLVS